MAAAVMPVEGPAGTNSIRVRMLPLEDAALPVCENAEGMPTITWRDGQHTSFVLQLTNVDDAADYLRRMSRQFVALACDVEAEREKARERMPEGMRS